MRVTPQNLTSWQKEMTVEGGELPPIRTAMLLFAVLTVVLLAALGLFGPDNDAHARDRAPSLCEQHAGRPGWDAVCDNTSGPR